MDTIPFMNLKDSFPLIYDEVISKITHLIKNTQFIGGEEVRLFEKEFASFCNSSYAVGCANGTDAILVALKALEIGPGDTVLVPANTFIATSEAVTLSGAQVDFIDVKLDTSTIDPVKLEAYLERYSKERNVKAVIPVHLYGRMADMEEIGEIAKKFELKIIEDSAQAHGAMYNSHAPGFYGDIATFSFYPGKNLGAFGDAGALVTNDHRLHTRCKSLVDHGRLGKKYEHDIEGGNMRLDTIQAAVLRIKLKYLSEWTRLRVEKAIYYVEQFPKIEAVTPPVINDSIHQTWHLFVIKAHQRDELQHYLKQHNISTGIHYPIPLHLQPAYHYKGYSKGDFPVTEELSSTILSLPFWPEITKVAINQVCNTVEEFYRNA